MAKGKFSSVHGFNEEPYDLTYQGTNKGSGKAWGELNAFDARSKIETKILEHPKAAENEDEALHQLRRLKSPDDLITVYRAAPADHINPNDWVFLSRKKADRFAHRLFNPTEMKPGYKVLSIRVKASDVMYTGKNIEFAYIGKRMKG